MIGCTELVGFSNSVRGPPVKVGGRGRPGSWAAEARAGLQWHWEQQQAGRASIFRIVSKQQGEGVKKQKKKERQHWDDDNNDTHARTPPSCRYTSPSFLGFEMDS